MSRLLDIVQEMAIVVPRLEKRLAEAEIPIEASQLEHVPPPAQFLYVPTELLVVGYEILAPGMPVGVLVPRQASSEEETVWLLQFVIEEGSGSQGPEQHNSWDCRDAILFLKNGGQLFYGSMNPKVALEWIDTTR